MITSHACRACFIDQMRRAAKQSNIDPDRMQEIISALEYILDGTNMNARPPEILNHLYAWLMEQTGDSNPYAEIKRSSTEQALRLYPRLKEMVRTAHDPLQTAVRIAIAGNIIDFGSADSYDLSRALQDTLHKDFARFDMPAFRERLARAEHVLYIGDNAGETVFDRVLIEHLQKPVTYAVRDRPVINDATYEDALQAGLHKVAAIASTGCSAPGAVLSQCSSEFLRSYQEADMVISKGQGNYEALIGEEREIFFLLRTKCKVVSDLIGVRVGDIILELNRA